MGKSWKKILSIGICVIMLLGLCACDTSDVWVFSLNGEKLYQKEVAAFSYVYVMEHNIRDEEQLEEVYDNSETYEEYYKRELEDEIVSTTLLYKEATENKIKLSGEEQEQVKTSAARVVERFGEDVLEEFGLSESDIEKVYEMRMLGEAYLESLSESDSKDSVGEQTENAEVNGDTDNEQYVKVYQVMFPTVELDDNGMVRTDADGKLRQISALEASDMKEEAVMFAENAKQGGDIEELVEDCSESVSGANKYLKYSDLEKKYKNAIDGMSVGDVSDVIESDYGYYVVCLLKKDDKEYAKTMDTYQQETDVLALHEKELERLYSEYAQENRGYKNTSLWDTIDIKDYMK